MVLFWTESREDPICPCCGAKLVYRDRRRRIMKEAGGERKDIMCRRLKCNNCQRITIELPDKLLIPYKHYQNNIIQDVIDEYIDSDDIGYEDYPCELTMQRWKDWIIRNKEYVRGHMRSIDGSFDLSGLDEIYLASSLLDKLRDFFNEYWLSAMARIIYNTGGKLLAFY